MRRATASIPLILANALISIHTLHEEGDRHETLKPHRKAISIHALREEGDGRSMKSYSTSSDFYPRPPRGGRPRTFCTVHQASSYFYPRPPRGGRRLFLRLLCGGFRFLSTPSARRATRRPFEHGGQKPRFLSTPSARRATVPLGFGVGKVLISIHALREEGDVGRNLVADLVVISIHALREEGDVRP